MRGKDFMLELQLHIIEFLSRISSLKIFCPIIIILFITKNIKKIKVLNYSLIITYSFLFIFSFSFRDYGIDSVRLTIIKNRLSPIAYMSYKQDLEIFKTLKLKRIYSFSVYKNIESLNKEFEYISNYLEKEKNNKPKVSCEIREYLNFI